MLLLLPLSGAARGDEAWRRWVTPERFRDLAVEIAPRVDLFQQIWKADPLARLYGGTSRDFLWFLRGELAKAKSPGDLEARIRALKSRPIGVKEFVVGNSDVDVITSKDLSGVEYEKDLVTRIEAVSPSWFTPGTARFEQEARQGYVPVEKIKLGLKGFAAVEGLDQGDGVREIYDARPTLHFDERVRETGFFKEKENHPVLLALRYLRQAAVTYYRLHGTGYPDTQALLSIIDEKSRESLERIFAEIRENPKELAACLARPQFRNRINKALGKAFRSYTNPTAAKVLFEHFGVDTLLEPYGDRIDPYHTLMYTKYRNARDLIAQRAQLLSQPESYLSTVGEYFHRHGIAAEADGGFSAYHGTDTMENYRNIVFQGNVASGAGSAGAGVYAVDLRSRKFAETWRGENTLVVRLKLAPQATLVDITEGEGKRAFERFKAARESLAWRFDGNPVAPPGSGDDFTAFADFVGADVLRYDYGSTKAYVIKNGGAIQGQAPFTIPLLTVEEVKERLASSPDPVSELIALGGVDRGLWAHWHYLMDALVEPKLREPLRELMELAAGKRPLGTRLRTSLSFWDAYPEIREKVLGGFIDRGIREKDQGVLQSMLSYLLDAQAPASFSKRLDGVIAAATRRELLLDLAGRSEMSPRRQKALAARILAVLKSRLPEPEDLPLVKYYSERVPAEAGVVALFKGNPGFQAAGNGIRFFGAGLFHPGNPIWRLDSKARARAVKRIVDFALGKKDIDFQRLFVWHVLARPEAYDMREELVKIISAPQQDAHVIATVVTTVLKNKPWSDDVPLKRLVAQRTLDSIGTVKGLEVFSRVLVPYYLEESGKTLPEAVGAIIEAEASRDTRVQPALRELVTQGFARHYPAEIPEALLDRLIRTAHDYDVLDDLLTHVMPPLPGPSGKALPAESTRLQLCHRARQLLFLPDGKGHRSPELISYMLRNSGYPVDKEIDVILKQAERSGRGWLYPVLADHLAHLPDPMEHRDVLLKIVNATHDQKTLEGLVTGAFSVPAVAENFVLVSYLRDRLIRLLAEGKLGGESLNFLFGRFDTFPEYSRQRITETIAKQAAAGGESADYLLGRFIELLIARSGKTASAMDKARWFRDVLRKDNGRFAEMLFKRMSGPDFSVLLKSKNSEQRLRAWLLYVEIGADPSLGGVELAAGLLAPDISEDIKARARRFLSVSPGGCAEAMGKLE